MGEPGPARPLARCRKFLAILATGKVIVSHMGFEHAAQRLRTERGDRWVVIHKPAVEDVAAWRKLAAVNQDEGLREARDEERSQAVKDAYLGFSNGLDFAHVNEYQEQEVLVSFVSRLDPAHLEFEDVLPAVELYMTVTTQPEYPIVTHIGITRVVKHRDAPGKLALNFHAIVAGLVRKRAQASVPPAYMITAPLPFMAKLLASAGAVSLEEGGQPGYVQKGQKFARQVKVSLPGGRRITAEPWLAKHAFGTTRLTPMLMDYARLAASADLVVTHSDSGHGSLPPRLDNASEVSSKPESKEES